MIAKNEERFLRQALRSVRGVVDEIIFCDTGSTDTTPELASEFGAKVFRIDWSDDFAAARNFSLSQASMPWVLVLDADEMLSEELAHNLRPMASAGRRGIQFQRVHYENNQELYAEILSGAELRLSTPIPKNYLRTLDLRLFPNAPELRYSGRVHEVIQPSLEKIACPVTSSDLVIHHFAGLKPQSEKLAKSENYLKLGEQKVLELPHHWGPWLELAIELQHLGRYQEALPKLEKALELWPENHKAWYHLGLSQLELGKIEEALKSFHTSLSYGADNLAILNATGVALLRLGHIEEAKRCFEAVLNDTPADPVALSNMADCAIASRLTKQS